MARPNPGEIRQLNQLLEEQAEMRDPFRNPRMVSAREQGIESLGAEPQEQQVSLLQERREAPQTNLREFLSTRDPEEQQRMLRTEIPRQLEGIGLGDLAEGLTFNQMGRLNLMLRLRERFGENFFENESARSAIALFDEALGKDEQEQEEEMTQMLSGADRTLEELLRMQGRTR